MDWLVAGLIALTGAIAMAFMARGESDEDGDCCG